MLYGVSLWGQAARIHLNKILKLQKRTLRLINFGDYASDAVSYFISANILPIDMLYFKSVSTLMYEIYNGNSPLPILSMFSLTGNVSSYNTRFSEKKILFPSKYPIPKKFRNHFLELVLIYGIVYQKAYKPYRKVNLNKKCNNY